MSPPTDRLLRAHEVCARLNVSRAWLYRNVTKLPFAIRVRNIWRFSENGLNTYLANNQQEAL